MSNPVYNGFSFFRSQYDKSIIVTDIQLVNQDLYNHIFTRKGTRVKMPTFGTTIPDMLFEPLTEDLLFQIDGELREVFNYDPRVSLTSLNIYPFYDQQSVFAIADLRYIELNISGRFDLNLEFGN
jgi:phage baseplate assembly protein W